MIQLNMAALHFLADSFDMSIHSQNSLLDGAFRFSQAQETLRQALAMGADRAIHINSDMRTDQVK
jgi:hypothetical protein